MAISPVVALTAALCPTITGPTSELLISNGNPSTFGTITQGDVGNLVTQFNRNGVRGDLIGRTGGGCYGIGYGLQLSATGSGLTLNVSLGHAMIDGPVQLAANATLACINGYNWIYLTQGGTLTSTTSATTTPPAPPSAYCCFLGRVHATAGNIDAIDKSGVLTYAGGICYRPTADAGAPTDTPPSTLSFLALTSGGNFMWIGALGAYFNLIDSLKVLSDDTHGSSGSLADLIVGDGTTVTVSVVEITGVWKLQLSATTSAGNMVSAYTGDLHPGFLNQKLKSTSDVTWTETDDTLGTPSSKQMEPVLVGTTITLNHLTITINPLETRHYRINFAPKGSFPDGRYEAQVLFETSSGTNVDGIFSVYQPRSDGPQLGTVIPHRDGTHLTVVIANRASDFYAQQVSLPTTFDLVISLTGFNWTAAGSPTNALITEETPDPSDLNTQFLDWSRQTFSAITVNVPPGYFQKGWFNITPAGSFSEISWFQADCTNEGTGLEGVLISRLANSNHLPYDGSGTCKIYCEVLNPSGNIYGYSGHTPMQVTVVISGRGWFQAYSPASATFIADGSPMLIDGGGGGGDAWVLGGNATGVSELLGLTDHQAVTVLGGTVTVESDTGAVNIEGANAVAITATTGDASLQSVAGIASITGGTTAAVDAPGNVSIQSVGGELFLAGSTEVLLSIQGGVYQELFDSNGAQNWNGNEVRPSPSTITAATSSLGVSRYQDVNATSNSIALAIPAASAAVGRVVTLVRVDNTLGNTVTITPASGNINFTTSYILAMQSSVTIWSDGTAWYVV